MAYLTSSSLASTITNNSTGDIQTSNNNETFMYHNHSPSMPIPSRFMNNRNSAGTELKSRIVGAAQTNRTPPLGVYQYNNTGQVTAVRAVTAFANNHNNNCSDKSTTDTDLSNVDSLNDYEICFENELADNVYDDSKNDAPRIASGMTETNNDNNNNNNNNRDSSIFRNANNRSCELITNDSLEFTASNLEEYVDEVIHFTLDD